MPLRRAFAGRPKVIGAVLVLAVAVLLSATCAGPARRAVARERPSITAARVALIRERILRAAESQIGYHESGNYCSIYGPCELWCSLFTTWAWEQAGVPIPRYAFVGYVYDWAALYTRLLRPRQTPQPGDTVLYGTGPQSPQTAVHIGIVEAVYPRYLVTIEGDVDHGVRRFVVPRANAESIGESGPIWAYAQPIGPVDMSPQVVDPEVRGPLTQTTVRAGGPLDSGGRRIRQTIDALQAFQHIPFRSAAYRVAWTGIDSRGRVLVTLTTAATMSHAVADWTTFLRRFGGARNRYVVTYDAPPDPPAEVTPPSISGVAAFGATLTAVPASWANEPTSEAYQWERCVATATTPACAAIPGAIEPTYTPTGADIGAEIELQETATNVSGTSPPATSQPTATVAP